MTDDIKDHLRLTVENLLRDPLVTWSVESHSEEILTDSPYLENRPTGVLTISITGTPTSASTSSFKC